MSDRSPMGSGHFHEAPLVVFSALSTAGAGIGVAHLLQGFIGGAWELSVVEALILAGFLVAGGVVSAMHLGRPIRAPLALRGFGRSPLSNEVIALGATLTLVISALMLTDGALGSVLGFLTAMASTFFLLSLGGVYVLPGQVAWQGLAAASPLFLGLVWGMLLEVALLDRVPPYPWLALLWVALILDAGIAVGRWRTLEKAGPSAAAVHPVFFRRRRILLGSRLAAGSVATLLAVSAAAWIPAILFFSVGLVLDRLGFYGLALRRTTESEVRRVEALLQR